MHWGLTEPFPYRLGLLGHYCAWYSHTSVKQAMCESNCFPEQHSASWIGPVHTCQQMATFPSQPCKPCHFRARSPAPSRVRSPVTVDFLSLGRKRSFFQGQQNLGWMNFLTSQGAVPNPNVGQGRRYLRAGDTTGASTLEVHVLSNTVLSHVIAGHNGLVAVSTCLFPLHCPLSTWHPGAKRRV